MNNRRRQRAARQRAGRRRVRCRNPIWQRCECDVPRTKPAKPFALRCRRGNTNPPSALTSTAGAITLAELRTVLSFPGCRKNKCRPPLGVRAIGVFGGLLPVSFLSDSYPSAPLLGSRFRSPRRCKRRGFIHLYARRLSRARSIIGRPAGMPMAALKGDKLVLKPTNRPRAFHNLMRRRELFARYEIVERVSTDAEDFEHRRLA
jgi:hypothetical protein